MRGPRVGPRPGPPRGSRGLAAFPEGPVPGGPPRKEERAPSRPHGLPCRGPWKPGGGSGPQGGPRGWCVAGPGGGGKELSTRQPDVLGGQRGPPSLRGLGSPPLLHPPRYLETLWPRGPAAGAGLAPQAPQEVADVEEVLVEAVVQAVGLQIHLEALARQNDGWGVFIGLQDLLCRGEGGVTPRPGGSCPATPA